MPTPATSRPTTHVMIEPGPAWSVRNAATMHNPAATRIGPAMTMRRTTRGAVADALGISPSVHPSASAAPRNPAASGANPARRWPNSGMKVSTVDATARTTMVRYIHFSADAPKVDGGSTPCAARRSAATKAISSSTPPRTIAAVIARLETTPAMLTSKAAVVSRVSDSVGTGLGSVASAVWAGSARGTRAAMARAARTSTPKAIRQAPNCAKMPPTAGPANVPTPHMAETRAAPRVQRCCGSAALMTA
ncbi:unannotated protein [freshwater metagenome]|uniref:Unannotated protein n=1 Tax=freshwater metagenome TaxID=449393 RepID=A0A6J7HBY7_9ZZZZ